MSSPDPLNDEDQSDAPPPSPPRRVTRSRSRSHRSSRSVSRGLDSASGDSPRKQRFELEVGGQTSPQRLVVTVETDGDASHDSPPNMATRRILPSPGPRAGAITTTIPLKDSVEEEEDDLDDDTLTTPSRRRIRQRRSNGTPIPKKRRAGTPIRRSPRRHSTSRDIPLNDEENNELAQLSPTPKRRKGRPPTPGARPPAPDDDEMGSDTSINLDRISRGSRTPTPTPKPKRRVSRPSKSVSIEPPTLRDTTGSPAHNRLPRPEQESEQDQSHVTPIRRRNTRAAGNPSAEPSSNLRMSSAARTTELLRTARRRRQALAPEELAGMAEMQQPEQPAPQPTPAASDNDMDLIGTVEQPAEEEEGAYVFQEQQDEEAPVPTAPFAAEPSPPPEADEPQSDIWMATMSEQVTPRPARASGPGHTPGPDARLSAEPDNDQRGQPVEAGGYGDASSAVGGDDGETLQNATQHNDTVAQEDFSMIFMDSIPSFQDFRSSFKSSFNRSVPAGSQQPVATASSELGDETNRIINDTLESLRQSVGGAHQEDHGDEQEQRYGSTEDGYQRDDWFAEPHSAREEMDLLQPQQDEMDEAGDEFPSAPMDEDLQDNHEAEESLFVQQPEEQEQDQDMPVDEPEQEQEQEAQPSVEPSSEAEQPQAHTSAASTPAVSNPAWSAHTHRAFSPSLARSPFRANISPLRRKVLDSSVRYPDLTPRVQQVEARSLQHSPTPGAVQLPDHITPGTALSQPPRRPPYEDDSNAYDDSFSEIPQEILDAATPRKATADFVPMHEELEEQGEEQVEEDEPMDEQPAEEDVAEEEQEAEEMEEEEVQQEEEQEEEAGEEAEEEVEGEDEAEEQGQEEEEAQEEEAEVEAEEAGDTAEPLSAIPQARLPTPDDTPPNVEAADVNEGISQSHAPFQSSSPVDPHVQLTSEHNAAPSPQAPQMLGQSGYRARFSVERASSAMESTPVRQMSSPAQGPFSAGAEHTADKAPRPALSAIVRAGRELQNVTSDPPSPEGRDNQLGSPFRSSASKESWSGSREPRGSHEPRESQSRQQSLLRSPSRRAPSHQRQSASLDRITSDPFAPGPATRNTGQHSFMEALGQSTIARPPSGDGLHTERPRASSVASSMRITPPDEAMSWVADEGPISPRLRGDASLRTAAGITSGLSREQDHGRQAPTEPQPQPEPQPESQHQEDDDDDETDIWELEAEREEVRSPTHQLPFAHKDPDASSVPFRRAPLPNTWMRRSANSSFNTSFGAGNNTSMNANTSMNTAAAGADESEEYSLLAQRQKAEAAEKQAAAAAAAAATAPESAKASRLDLSSFFSSPAAIPGKLVEKFFPSRNATPRAAEQQQQQQQQPAPPPAVPTSTMFPAAQPHQPVVYSSPLQEQETHEDREEHGSASPDTPERLQVPLSAQKKRFAPRPRQTNQGANPNPSFFQSSSPAAAPAAAPAVSSAPTPPQMQLSHADIHRWQQQMSEEAEDDRELQREQQQQRPPPLQRSRTESLSPPRPFLRPLPPHNASPTKSSLRSPLKPHTPGRVVEFTSSVLSPADQGRQRQQNQQQIHNLAYVEAYDDDEAQEEEGAARAEEQPLQDEDEDEDISMQDAPPPPPSGPSLSQTTWTRQHWLLMEKLIEHRRNTTFTNPDAESSPSAELLGKKVRCQGQALVLQQWHLDCVDAFRSIVGDWDVDVLAKRLFALLLGQKRRRLRAEQKAQKARPAAPSTSAAPGQHRRHHQRMPAQAALFH